MTIRNLMKSMYGKLVLNGSEIVDLGRAPIPELTQRVTATLKSRIDIEINSWNLCVSEDKTQLAKMMKGGVQAEYEHEGLNPNSPLFGLDKDVIESMKVVDDDDPSPFEGITLGRLWEAQESHEYKTYRIFALHPEKRQGVEQGVIEAARVAWQEAYPDVAEHVPVWKDDS